MQLFASHVSVESQTILHDDRWKEFYSFFLK